MKSLRKLAVHMIVFLEGYMFFLIAIFGDLLAVAVLRIFKERQATPDATCGALSVAEYYLRLSYFQGGWAIK